ncbi:chromosomal replication initiator protein DnaA [Proteiniclasticum ruminis]|jgi:chromosomal replication initiator protein|uniref:Chromosomal replication initiator protein DnaA n=1 Tax=Proteiniclasticum ruminis TaxID=398199 RepID=A0A1G8L7Z0_9CLOT|nr:chromosomal replication initiator protein DnaA [Proteiniclasticum ruminis]SDI51763.1 chromosomal replication initiator protein [Proteiniclasticum ruminis]
MNTQLAETWEKVLKILKVEIMSEVSYNTWILGLKPIGMRNGVFMISVPNELTLDIINQRYMLLFKESIKHVLNQDVDVQCMVGEPESDDSKSEEEMQKDAIKPAAEAFGSLNSKYTFDSFVIGNSNRFAHAASVAVAESPANAYNPLFLYGGVGLGKTHLMHAIGHHIQANNPKAKVVYVSSEKFTNELINSIRYDKNLDFRNKYRNVDVLLVDDIQFIAGKESTQEEFFHTFNELYEARKQIIISSDRPPNEIPTLEDRLRTRFAWGLQADIQAPDFETRIAILKKKAEIEKYVVSSDVMVYIATKIKSNIRELEGALTRVMAYSSLTNNKNITVDLAAEALKDIISSSQTRSITIDLIQDVVANYYNLSVQELKSQRRTRNVAYPRQIAMYLSRKLTDMSLPKIGDEFGGRDHTTVIHAYEKISTALKSDDSLASAIRIITKKVNSQ